MEIYQHELREAYAHHIACKVARVEPDESGELVAAFFLLLFLTASLREGGTIVTMVLGAIICAVYCYFKAKQIYTYQTAREKARKHFDEAELYLKP